jgi:hypothetical protein
VNDLEGAGGMPHHELSVRPAVCVDARKHATEPYEGGRLQSPNTGQTISGAWRDLLTQCV